MEVEVKTWLKDIEQAIIEINSFIPDLKNFKDFQKDLKTKRAVERNIEIIGEAMRWLVGDNTDQEQVFFMSQNCNNSLSI